MTKAEAIADLSFAWYSNTDEHSGGRAQDHLSWLRMLEAFAALGISEEEVRESGGEWGVKGRPMF